MKNFNRHCITRRVAQQVEVGRRGVKSIGFNGTDGERGERRGGDDLTIDDNALIPRPRIRQP